MSKYTFCGNHGRLFEVRINDCELLMAKSNLKEVFNLNDQGRQFEAHAIIDHAY